MTQSVRPRYTALLPTSAASLRSVADAVARDIAGPGEDLEVLAGRVLPAVIWLVERLAAAPELSDAALAELRDEGARMAREGEPLQRMLDRYLSAGWVLWDEASQADAHADAAALADLGRALLHGLDRVAAAIGEGYSESERVLVARTAAARREFLDELLELPAGDALAAARVRRRGAPFGFEIARELRVMVADVGHELEEGGSEIERIARALERPVRQDRVGATVPEETPIATTRRGLLVVLSPPATAGRLELDAQLDAIASRPWVAVVTGPVHGLPAIGAAYRDAVASLAAARRAGRTGRIGVDEVVLERALLADEELARRALDAELGGLRTGGRTGVALVATLDAWLRSGQSVRATARALDVAPRTVAYRLARIEALLGRSIRGATAERLGAALLLHRLLTPDDAPPTAAADPPRRGPRDRSRSRRCGAPET
jgi:hypothetical protein